VRDFRKKERSGAERGAGDRGTGTERAISSHKFP
jgi:hypothetical protein